MFSSFFIDRPIFSAVLSIVIVIAGGVAVFTLPVAQYPDITPPTVEVSATYPGANAEVLLDTVAAPVEQQVNGVENMLYMASQCTNDGTYRLTVTFKLGTNLDMAQVLVQNRVSLALPSLPDMVNRRGVNVKKKSPSTMMIVNLHSPSGEYDNLELSNYATIQLKDELARLEGVGDITFLGQRDYSMRVWLDPEKLAARDLTPDDVVNTVTEQNVQVAAGQIGQPPVPRGQNFQYTLNTLGRLVDSEQFADMILKTDEKGRIVRLRDVGRLELGAQAYDQVCTLDTKPSVAMSVYQLPGSNALKTAERVNAKMVELSERFPPGIKYDIVYNTTPFIKESIDEVFKALRDAVILVAIVVLVFLQNWRSTLIPLIAVPVSIIGTFAVMAGMGFSLNNLSLFGLVLAIGIVVDDAIVVVEAVEHHIEHGMSPRDATRQAMSEVAGPVVAVALVLCAVFIPCTFITGIVGQFFRQFALTVAVSTVISAFNSLTLSPALSALLLKPKAQQRDPLTLLLNLALGWFFKLFNAGFNVTTTIYTKLVGLLLRLSLIVLVIYGGLLYLTGWSFGHVPTGFIPEQDKGFLMVNVLLPDSASLERTQEVMAVAEKIAKDQPGVAHTVALSGQSLLLNANAPNFGSMYVMLDEFHERHAPDRSGPHIAAELTRKFQAAIQEASISVFGAPPVDGLGNAGGFNLIIEDRNSQGLEELEGATNSIVEGTAGLKPVNGVFTSFRARTPWLRLNIDRTKAESLQVSLGNVFEALQVYMGSYYVNDFNRFGRTWQVNIQADANFRNDFNGLAQIKVRNARKELVPLPTIASLESDVGPVMIMRYNMYPAASINGAPAPGVSTGDAIDAMEKLSAETLPRGMSYEWTELMLLQTQAGNTAILAFAGAVVLVFLVLAAQYESWSLPLAVILVVPMCLLCSVAGVAYAKMDINIFTQIGFVVLVGLASKNAILIVEFAKSRREAGVPRRDATLEACQLRLRPII
ncbi:MAG: efflux RND transporter permease subunit, partial [Planctomycetes bacterium]|nr:efflux RND transporter permease subunit [Planctomycetota bacterium]